MPIVTSTELFKKAYDGGYAIGAFNINNMEIVQGITDAAAELKSPVILQASQGARKYANSVYLVKLVEAAAELTRSFRSFFIWITVQILRPARIASTMDLLPL